MTMLALLGVSSGISGFAVGYAVYRPHAPAVAYHPPADGHRPNVLVIVWDTVRADHTSLYGYGKPTTPNLEALAKDSVVFDRAIAAGEWTAPSHASIFTGLPVSAHGVGNEHLWL